MSNFLCTKIFLWALIGTRIIEMFNGLLTLHRNWTSTTGNNGSWFLPLSWTSVSIFTAHVRSTTGGGGGGIFSVCLTVHTRGVPQDGVPPLVRSGWGTPHGQVRLGYPPPKPGQVGACPPPARSGYPPPPSQVRSGWGTPLVGMGYPSPHPPPPPPRIGYVWRGYAAGGTPLTVSCRRTVLLYNILGPISPIPSTCPGPVQCE